MVTEQQRRTAYAITSIFETGSPSLQYDVVAVLPDGAGISYGAHQATDASGALDAVVEAYLERRPMFTPQIGPYLQQLDDPACQLADDDDFRALLVHLAKDPAMREAQDEVFSSGYWMPVVELCDREGLVLPLTHAALYDTAIHSGLGRIDSLRRYGPALPKYPPARGGDETTWIRAMMTARSMWLRGYTSPDPRKQELIRSLYWRPEVYLQAMDMGYWELRLPLLGLVFGPHGPVDIEGGHLT